MDCNPPRPFYKTQKTKQVQILIKVDTGYNCDWRNIVALQPDGFKGQTENEKEIIKD